MVRLRGRLEQQPYSRETIYPHPGDTRELSIDRFRSDSGNDNFRTVFMTWVSLSILVILYPGISLAGIGEDPTILLKSLDSFMLMLLLVTTIIFQWAIFSVNYLSVRTEGTGLAGIGFTKFRGIYIAWGVAFLLAANLLLAGVAWVLGQIGMPLSGDVIMLVPTDPIGKVVWVMVSITAGVCEETAFRGYLMTRLRLVGRMNSWVIPTIISAVAFGACHAYQGMPGFIAITIYGALFSILYIRTGSIWPGIIAHSLQDLGALIWPLTILSSDNRLPQCMRGGGQPLPVIPSLARQCPDTLRGRRPRLPVHVKAWRSPSPTSDIS
ncbi:MAG: CPBP family intramembrane metalloprotease [bacterium]|nr:CPBP family intramembrane metalloprotease [bacterium]